MVSTRDAAEQKPPQKTEKKKLEGGIWETIVLVVQVILIVFVVRTFLFQPFNIPSSSMYPTLKIGDYIFVSKFSYGYSRYSFNFSLGFKDKNFVSCCNWIDFDGRKFFADTPKRGDVAVFKLPTDTRIDYIKRVIGLPGDRIEVQGGVVFINGTAVKRVPVEPYVDTDNQGVGGGHAVQQFEETLPNGVTYRVLDVAPNGTGDLDNTTTYVVPQGHYFMMGDNRDSSLDSRVQHAVGYVPIENFVGRANIIFFSLEPGSSILEFWKWPFEVRWNRLLHVI